MATAPSSGGGTLTYAQLKGVWLDAAKGTKYASNTWASLMAAIAEAESSGDPSNTNPNDNGGTQTSWGLWQISLGNHNAPSPNWADPVTNAKLAIGKLNSQGLSAWGTYVSGAYKAFLSNGTAAATFAGSGAIPTATSGSNPPAAASGSDDCLWPGGSRDIGLGLHAPCLFSYGEARALLAGGFIVGGALVSMFFLGAVMAAMGAFAAAQKAGGGVAEAGGILASLTGNPEVGVPLAAAGAEVRSSGVRSTLRRGQERKQRNQQAQQKNDERQYDEVAARRRDSAKGRALRDREAVPF